MLVEFRSPVAQTLKGSTSGGSPAGAGRVGTKRRLGSRPREHDIQTMFHFFFFSKWRAAGCERNGRAWKRQRSPPRRSGEATERPRSSIRVLLDVSEQGRPARVTPQQVRAMGHPTPSKRGTVEPMCEMQKVWGIHIMQAMWEGCC